MREFSSFLLASIFMSVISYSQQKQVDSLQNLLIQPKEDTITAKRYALLAFYSLDSTDFYANKALLLSQNLRWSRGIAEAKYLMVNMSNHSRSLSVLFDCLKIYEELKDTIGLIDCSFLINIIYKFLEDYHKSAEYANKCLDYAKSLNDTAWIWNALYSLGNAYASLEQKDSTLFYFQEAFRFANFMENPQQKSVMGYYTASKQETMGWSLHGLGRAQQLLNHHDLALNYYNKGLVYSSQQTNPILASDLQNSISNCYLETGELDSAIKYARITLNEALSRKYDLNVLSSYTNLAHAYEGKNNDSAVKYFKLASAMRKEQFNAKNKTEVANLTFNETERQKELKLTERRSKEERNRNLQFAIIGVGLISFIVVSLLLSQSIIVKSGLVRFLGVVALLLVFEFINLFIHPFVADFTHHSPLWMFLIMVSIAALLVPAHHKLEKWITHQLVEKNKRIRLAAAKKTIQQLEG